MPKKNRDLELLYEIGALRRNPRQWQRFFGTDFQNITEHSYRVIWNALIIAAREGKGDPGKIIKMALVHDVVESRSTDVDYLSRQYVERKEELSLDDMFEGTSIGQEFREIWREYEKRESIEAKIVKDADVIDVDLEIREQGAKGVPVETLWKHHHRNRNRELLFTETAKRMFDEIYESDPHQWHISGRNRVKDGDWKKGDIAGE